ncbi:MAG: hypothetical protein ABIL40_11555 [candidate division WOR-3 bacterium]
MICIDIPEEVYTMKAKKSIIKSNARLTSRVEVVNYVYHIIPSSE